MQLVRDHVTDARARRLAATRALDLLGHEDPSCPTCLRPFHGEELDSVRRIHEEAFRAAEEAEARLQVTIGDHEQRLAQLDKLRDAVLGLPQPPVPPTMVPIADGSDYDSALMALQHHDTEVGRLKQQIDGIAEALRSDDDRREALQLEQRSYRHEAIAKATADAFSHAAEQTSRYYIEPLTQEVQGRWKKLFGEGGLQLKPDGAIVRIVGERELSSATLSGGERIWARLVTHLLVLAASTRLPFAWFDEPLEHLDPRARRAVAASLATATQAGGPTQLIVTTYEHAIARQLAADLPGTSIIRLRRGPGG
jgi:DNA repair exonuclease SbcCD ATPase subunit